MSQVDRLPSVHASKRWLPILTLWPGLAQLWSGQAWLGIFLAAFFAANLNAALVTRAVWCELVPATVTNFFFFAAGATWLIAMSYTLWWSWRLHPDLHRADADRLYRESLTLYLQGRWNEARLRCEQALVHDETDADALLQLGLSLARLGEREQAKRAFRQCLEQDGAGKWRWEVDQELARLAAP